MKYIKSKSLVLAISLISVLLGFYLFQVSEVVKLSYLIKVYSSEAKKISEENSELQVKAAGLFSLDNAERKVGNLGFVKVSRVRYIPISSDYLVKNSVQNYKAKPQ